MKKEILIAIDGSSFSNQSLDYCRALFTTQEDISFHLDTWITAGPTLMPSLGASQDSLLPTSQGLQRRKEDTATNQLVEAQRILLDAGIPRERIQTAMHLTGPNVAVAIQQTAKKKLMDAIVIGRRGLGGLSELFLGSVSKSLFSNCRDTPLWILDGEVKGTDIMVPLDGSPASLMAVDHLCHIFQDRSDLRICLFHCKAIFRGIPTCSPEDFYGHWDKEWCDRYLSGKNCLFNGPRQLLLEAGIPEKQIHILPPTSDFEEARSIVREAKKQHCGTIVLGRRMAGMAKGLFGGVSDRTITQVQDLALWIVG